jgi:hypothetical protein
MNGSAACFKLSDDPIVAFPIMASTRHLSLVSAGLEFYLGISSSLPPFDINDGRE